MKTSSRRSVNGVLFLLPWLIALTVFVGYPFCGGFYFSFCEYPPLKGPLFIGLANYRQLLGDPVFHRSFGVTLIYASVAIPLGVLLALTLALLLNSRIRGVSLYRVIFFLPHLVPTVVVAILWLWIFNPKFGLLNAILGACMGAADVWTGMFFELRLAEARSVGIKPTAMLLVLPYLGLPFVHGRRLHRVVGVPDAWRTPLRWLVLGACGLAAATLLHALLAQLMPGDLAKLHAPGWLSDGRPFPSCVPWAPSWALWAIILMGMWGVGQMAVIYLAKLQDVPVQLYEAADMDGATWWQKTRHITIPLISPVILFNVVMAIIGTFQVFTEPYIMTGGGPEDKTRFLAMFVYDQAFQYQRVGYASAVAWVLFLLIVVLTLLAFRLSRRHVYYEQR